MNALHLVLLAFLSTLLTSPIAHAQFKAGAVAASMGGAGRGAVDPSEVHYLNPAAVAHLQRYYTALNYGSSSHPADGEMTQYGVLLADGTRGTLFNGALSYQRRRFDRPGFGDTQQDIQASIAGFAARNVAFGLSLHRQADLLNDGNEQSQINGHTGFLFNPIENLGLGIALQDFWPASETVSESVRLVPTLGIGAHYILVEFFRLRMDIARPLRGNDRNRNDVSMGLETFFHPQWALRLGNQWRETADQNWLTAGLGFRGPKLSVDYTFQRDMRTSDGIRHMVDLWIPL